MTVTNNLLDPLAGIGTHGVFHMNHGLPEIVLGPSRTLGTLVEELYHFKQVIRRVREGQSWEGIVSNPVLHDQIEAQARNFLDSLGFARVLV